MHILAYPIHQFLHHEGGVCIAVDLEVIVPPALLILFVRKEALQQLDGKTVERVHLDR